MDGESPKQLQRLCGLIKYVLISKWLGLWLCSETKLCSFYEALLREFKHLLVQNQFEIRIPHR